MEGTDADVDVDVNGGGDILEKDEEAEERAAILRDRFRLSVISIAETEGSSNLRSLFFSSFFYLFSFDFVTLVLSYLGAAKKQAMEIAEPVVACIADLGFKFAGHLSKP